MTKTDTRRQSAEFDRESDVRPGGTVARGIRGSGEDQRAWLSDAPVVQALGALGIAHAGVMAAPVPFQIVRTKLSGAYFTATLSGAGEIYLDGRWKRCGPGEAVLLLPGVLNALRAEPGASWEHCWVRIAAGSDGLQGAADRMQVITAWDAEPLRHAILGLRSAAIAKAAPALLQRWSELLLECVSEFRRSHAPDPRIVRLWDAVERRLSDPWAIDHMAAVANLSPEHLRRLCRQATGRAPHAHLMHLRMKRATSLLLSTDWTLERIADDVGYANPFAFSSAFKKVVGWSPSSYAQRLGS